MGRFGILRTAWRLTRPYWFSEERLVAWGLLAAIIALSLGTVYLNVRFNMWQADFFNALQNLDAGEFWHQLGIFSLLATIYILTVGYAFYLNQLLQVRWRRWMTTQYIGHWLGNQGYYRLQLADGGTDNPDQRIQEDLRLFTSLTLGLGLGLLTSVVTLGSFFVILWNLSGPADIPILGWNLHIPGYLVWAAIVYAVVGTWLTVKLGRPLVRLNFDQQRFEADFRFSMVRLRENAEQVAFYRGEAQEEGVFRDRFARVVRNWIQLALWRKYLLFYTAGYNQIAIIFPYIVAAPRYFAKEIQLGGLQQVADAFSQVQNALSYFVTAWPDIAEWFACIQRLSGFQAQLERIAETTRGKQPIEITRAGGGVSVDGLDLALPDGRMLRQNVNLDAAPGEAILVTGPSGSGKSTLLRAVAGIWPFGRGHVRLGGERTLFLPQRPYIPLGTLRHALAYPAADDEFPREALVAALETVGLGHLAGSLEVAENWAHRLSLGEQQRLAFARVLLVRPNVVFLDEATSALDEAAERELYALLRAAEWGPTIVSVGHRGTLRPFHDRTVTITGPETVAAS